MNQVQSTEQRMNQVQRTEQRMNQIQRTEQRMNQVQRTTQSMNQVQYILYYSYFSSVLTTWVSSRSMGLIVVVLLRLPFFQSRTYIYNSIYTHAYIHTSLHSAPPVFRSETWLTPCPCQRGSIFLIKNIHFPITFYWPP